jgi:outer membrane protein W
MRPAFAILMVLAAALPCAAADLELGIRHLAMTPMASGSFDGGEVEIVSSRGFGATAEVFWTPRVSTQFAATFVNPATFLNPADVDLGTFGIDTYALTARYHFCPQARFSPFAGGGGALVVFGDLEDRFGDDLEMTFDRQTAFLVEGGLRYRVRPSIILDVAVSYMPLDATPNFVRNDTTLVLPATVAVDPLTLSVGASWRF